MQNLAPGGFSAPQLGQPGGISAPHDMQKRARSGFWAAQAGQILSGMRIRIGQRGGLTWAPRPPASRYAAPSSRPLARRKTLNRIRSLFVLVLVLGSATFLWACGGDGGGDEDPEEVLQAATDSDQSIDSGTLDVSLDVSVGGEQEGSFELNASGPFQGGEGEFPSFDIAGDFSAEGDGQSFSADGALVSTGNSAFVEYQDTAYQLPQQVFDQFSALALSSQQQQESENEACQQALESKGLGPTALFTDLSNEGDEEIEGAQTIHITGGLDFNKVSEFIKTASDTPECAQGLGEQLGAAQLDQIESQLSQVQEFFKDVEIGIYVGKDDDLIHGFDGTFAIDAEGQEVDFDLQARIGDVNQPQTVEEPQNVQPLDSLLQNLGIDSSILNQALGQLGTAGAAGGGDLPQAGGSPAAPGSDATQAYLECIQRAQGAAALQQCQGLLQ
jgi:hypothetical protein